MMVTWLVHYDMWIGGGEGELAHGDRCLPACEADPACVGVQFHSNGQAQCYKLTDAHIRNIGQGHIPMSLAAARAQPQSRWSVYVIVCSFSHRVLATSLCEFTRLEKRPPPLSQAAMQYAPDAARPAIAVLSWRLRALLCIGVNVWCITAEAADWLQARQP